jgi:hypothetical protein
MTTSADTSLDDARQDAGLSQAELWLRYFELGGMATPIEVEAYLFGLIVPGAHDHEVLVHALNERFTELGRNHPVPHSGDVSECPTVRDRRPESGETRRTSPKTDMAAWAAVSLSSQSGRLEAEEDD